MSEMCMGFADQSKRLERQKWAKNALFLGFERMAALTNSGHSVRPWNKPHVE